MKVSVIIPNYNTAHYLSDSIDSVLQSNFKDYEIIVVDDGSVDDTPEVVKKYGHLENFSCIFQQNKGLAGARNTGIKSAKGDYLVFLDSDDIILPDKLFLQSDFLDKNPDYEAVYSSSVFYKDGESNFKIATHFPNYYDYILKPLLFGNFIHVNAIMVKRAAVIEVGLFDEKLRELEDWDLWLRLSLVECKFHHQDFVLSEVRLRKGSMTSNQKKMNTTMVKVLEKNIPYLKKNFPKDKKLWATAKAALLQYKLQAEQKSNFNQEVIHGVSELGIGFLPTALKFLIKRYMNNIINFENKTTSRLEEVWNE